MFYQRLFVNDVYHTFFICIYGFTNCLTQHIFTYFSIISHLTCKLKRFSSKHNYLYWLFLLGPSLEYKNMSLSSFLQEGDGVWSVMWPWDSVKNRWCGSRQLCSCDTRNALSRCKLNTDGDCENIVTTLSLFIYIWKIMHNLQSLTV